MQKKIELNRTRWQCTEFFSFPRILAHIYLHATHTLSRSRICDISQVQLSLKPLPKEKTQVQKRLSPLSVYGVHAHCALGLKLHFCCSHTSALVCTTGSLTENSGLSANSNSGKKAKQESLKCETHAVNVFKSVVFEGSRIFYTEHPEKKFRAFPL